MAYDATKSRYYVAAAIPDFTGGAWSIAKETSLNTLLDALRAAGIVNPSGTGTYNASMSRKFVAAPVANFDEAGTYGAAEQGKLNAVLAALRVAGIVNPSGTGTYNASMSRKFVAAPISPDFAAAYDATEEAKVNLVLAALRAAGVVKP